MTYPLSSEKDAGTVPLKKMMKKIAIFSSAHGGDCNELTEKISATKTRYLGSCRFPSRR
jgi:hypothetical protein